MAVLTAVRTAPSFWWQTLSLCSFRTVLHAGKRLHTSSASKAFGYAPAQVVASVFQVEHLMERSFTALSQGQQRIVLVIRALLSCDGSHGEADSVEPRPPDLVLLDEPMHGLDRAMRERLVQVLSVVKDYSTVVIVTHHEDEVPPFCSKVLQLEKV